MLLVMFMYQIAFLKIIDIHNLYMEELFSIMIILTLIVQHLKKVNKEVFLREVIMKKELLKLPNISLLMERNHLVLLMHLLLLIKKLLGIKLNLGRRNINVLI